MSGILQYNTEHILICDVHAMCILLLLQVCAIMTESLHEGLEYGKMAEKIIRNVQHKSTATTVGHLLLTALSSSAPSLVKAYNEFNAASTNEDHASHHLHHGVCVCVRVCVCVCVCVFHFSECDLAFEH